MTFAVLFVGGISFDSQKAGEAARPCLTCEGRGIPGCRTRIPKKTTRVVWIEQAKIDSHVVFVLSASPFFWL